MEGGRGERREGGEGGREGGGGVQSQIQSHRVSQVNYSFLRLHKH